MLDRGLNSQITLVQVEPGPLAFRDDTFDLVLSSGAFTQTEDKLGMFRECLRVLKPGGWISAYDWMKPEGESPGSPVLVVSTRSPLTRRSL